MLAITAEAALRSYHGKVPPRSLIPIVALAVVAGCLPNTVGTTATPTPTGELQSVAPFYLIPGGVPLNDSINASAFGADIEFRYGLNRQSDIGLRVPTFSGVVLSYQRRLTDPSGRTGVAVMPALGYVFGYGYGDLTTVVSGPVARTAEWYGGVRLMKTIPLRDSLDHHRVIFGGFVGLKVPAGRLEMMPEIGLFRGPPGLATREPSLNVVVSLTLIRSVDYRPPRPGRR